MATTIIPLLMIVLALYSIVDVNAWTTRSDSNNNNNDSSSRRSFLQNKLMTAGSIIGGLTLTLLPTSSNIGHAQDLLDEEIEVYFGGGCFCK
jgi:hypothetical protein